MSSEAPVHALVADDDPVTAAALAGSLRRWNLDVTIARDGDEAWRVISGERPPSLAIVDWMMPCMDGVDLCRRIRQTPAHAHMYLALFPSSMPCLPALIKALPCSKKISNIPLG